VTGPHPKTFAQLFCEQNHVSRSDFERVLISRTLHPQAKALRRLLQLIPGDYFSTDVEFIRQIGLLTRAGDFGWEVSANRRILRRRLRLRLSITRLRRIVMRTFKEQATTVTA
jgi:hypothetical protein